MMANPRPATTELSNYLLKIDLMGVSNPPINRTLSVPPSTTFLTLHYAIQIAFDWRNSHLHHFAVLDAPATSSSSAQPTHRLFRPPASTLLRLEPNPQDDLFDDAVTEKSKLWKLRDVFENTKYKNKKIEYLYDFGDNWEHSITLIGRASSSTNSIVCVSGEGGPAAEDCGGCFGWQDLKDLYVKHRHEERECEDPSAHDTMEWYENECLNGQPGGLKPGVWDKEAINDELDALA
jgi:Plasmid pRiA4b ORF-3-like protein